MDKGYSIPRIKGKVIKSVSDVSRGDEMSVAIKDGTIKTKVMEVINNG